MSVHIIIKQVYPLFGFNLSIEYYILTICPVNTWPANILLFLLFDRPEFFSTMTLINFFYGNKIPYHGCSFISCLQ